MRWPTYSKAKRLAAKLTVLNQETGALEPFRLNRAQRRVLKAALRTRRLVVGKGRQVGVSTVLAFLMLMLCIMNPGLPCAIVADEQSKANKLLAKVKGWAVSLLEVEALDVKNVESLHFVNGSYIDALTALSSGADGESRVGRSGTYGVVHATEQSFWRAARAVMVALTSTMLMNGVVWNESTGAPGLTLFRETFDNDAWSRVFVSVQDHANYELAADAISDAVFADLAKRFGFTRRRTAAWWWATLHRDFSGDEQRMCREFPVLVGHMWTFKEGRHIAKWTECDAVAEGGWQFYEEPVVDEDGVRRFSEPALAGIDTAHGLGGDHDSSAIGLIGWRTGRILATWRSNTIPIPEFQAFIDEAVRQFRPEAVVVESNGPGAAVWQHCRKHYGAVEHWSGDADGEVFERRDRLRWAIETGALKITGHLAEEAEVSAVKAKRNADGRVRPVFTGHDDVLSAVSFARKWREANPWRAPPAEAVPGQMSVAALLASKRSRDQVY